MNPEAGANVRLGSTGITIWGDIYRGPGKFHFRDFNWFDMPDVKVDDEPRPMGDGDFAPLSYLKARDLPMNGFVVENTHAELVHQMDRLKAQRGRTVRVAVDDPNRTTWADAEIRAVRFDPLGFAPEADFVVEFHMPDPRRFSSSAGVFASGEPVFHRGTYAATPDITVTGNMPSGYTVNGPDGKKYVVTQALTTGRAHRIDMHTGWLYLDGVLQQGAVSRAETWTIPPGRRVTMTLVPVSGSGALAILCPYTAT